MERPASNMVSRYASVSSTTPSVMMKSFLVSVTLNVACNSTALHHTDREKFLTAVDCMLMLVALYPCRSQ